MMKAMKKLNWLAFVLVLVLLVGLIPSKEKAFAGNGEIISSVTISINQFEKIEELLENEKLSIIAIEEDNSDEKKVVTVSKEGKAVFDDFFKEGVTYVITSSEIPHYSRLSEKYTGNPETTSIELDLKKSESVSVSGVVTDDDGDAYEGADIVFSAEGYEDVKTTSVKDGKYSVSLDKDHTYAISATAENNILSFNEEGTVFSDNTTDYDLTLKGAHKVYISQSKEDLKLQKGTVSLETNTAGDYVKEGSSYTLRLTPDIGYTVRELKINKENIGLDKLELQENGDYVYKVKKVQSKQDINGISFTPIRAKETIDGIDDIGDKLSLSGDKDIAFSSKDENSYLFNRNTKKISLSCKENASIGYITADSKTIKYELKGNQVDFSENTRLSWIIIKEDEKWNYYKFSKPLALIIDDAPPVVTVDRDDNWHKNTPIDISVKVERKKIKVEDVEYETSPVKKVYCVSGDDKETVLDSKELSEDGRYHFEVIPGKEGKIEYCIYAEDEAGNQSLIESNAAVKYDKTPPTIEEVELNNNSTISCSDVYGIGASEDISVKVEVNDLKEGEVRLSSGVKEIKLYRDDILYDTKSAQSGSATFELKKDDFRSGGTISFVGVDNVGNESDKIFLKDLTSVKINSEKFTEIPNDKIIIADAKFNINLNVESTKEGNNISGKNGANTYCFTNNEDLKLSINVEEVTEGNVELGCKKIKVGNREYTESDFEKDGKVYKLNVSGDSLGLQSGENEIIIEVFDNTASKATETGKIVVNLDNQAPEITKLEFNDSVTVGNPSIDKVFNDKKGVFGGRGLQEFGTYYNKPIQIVATSSDNASGVKSVTLYKDGKVWKTQNVNDNNQAVFLVPSSEFLVNGKYIEAKFEVEVTDCVNNVSDKIEPNTGNSNIKSSSLMVESLAPAIECETKKPDYVKGVQNWYSDNTQFSLKITDKESGIYSVKATLNDKVLVNEHNKQKIAEKEYTVDTKDADQNKDGSYKLQINVVDNAGNETTKTSTIYIDKNNPRIVSFEFDGSGYNEGKKTQFGVEKRDYGYYFKTNTLVTIKASDTSPSSGLKDITYYTVDKEGGKSQEITKEVDASNQINLTIPANFKGQIYACPRDNVLHRASNYMTPDSAILETSAQHKKETHIVLKKAEAKYKDANGLELYNKDVPVSVTITDSYSGIRKVEYSVVSPYDVGKNQSGEIEIDNDGEKTEKSVSGWTRSKKESNLVTELTGVINVSNDSNEIVVNVKMTDRAGNESQERIVFSIDKTNPVVSVNYDNNKPDPQNKEFYKEKRTATIVVTERNFNAKDIVYLIKNKDGQIPSVDLTKKRAWKKKVDKKDPNKTTYTARIPFDFDGKFTWNLSYEDRAKNKAKKIAAQKFVIDLTIPLLTVEYDNTDVNNGEYFKKERTATITIDEHNFDESRVEVIGKARNDGKKVTYPTISGWTTNKDTHTATIAYTADAKYSLEIKYADQAGNKAVDYGKDDFVIDKTKPSIQITGVKNKSANRGRVAPIIKFTDVNFNESDVQLSLRGVNNGKVKDLDGVYSNVKNGTIFTFANFKNDQKLDDIYTLKATITDYAGNVTKKQIVFSVNRFGSVYSFDANLKKIDKAYVTKEQDIIFTETNVDELQLNSMRVKMIKNGTPVDLQEGRDYVILKKGGDGEWSQYMYKISKNLFTGDGRYSVEVYSKDNAGNINENSDETKKASISFGIDKTAPVITPVDLANDTQYALDNKEVKVTVKDNLVLGDVKISLNSQDIPYKVKGDDYIINIPSNSSTQELKVLANDVAGNQQQVDITGFLVSTNLFVRWYNNLPLFVGSLVAISIIIILIVAFIIYKSRKKKVKVTQQ